MVRAAKATTRAEWDADMILCLHRSGIQAFDGGILDEALSNIQAGGRRF